MQPCEDHFYSIFEQQDLRVNLESFMNALDSASQEGRVPVSA
jgi:hypothetical protein